MATKFGFNIDLETGQRRGGTNSRPEHVKAVAEASLKRLRTDHIDLFYQHASILTFRSRTWQEPSVS
jgi:aryl-alcohol dehydrogenase-like predicted oxidoreductase